MSLALAESTPPISPRHATRRGVVAMPYRTVARAVVAAISALLLQFAPAEAQVPRFVATTGNDSNTCRSEFPCRTLQRAHDAAGHGGKVVVLDSGDFGPVVITQSIAIVATGVHAHLFGAGLGGGTKITIDAGPDDVIDIDGLAMARPVLDEFDTSGIDFISGGKLHVRNCAIRTFTRAGIHVRGAGSKHVVVSDCTIADNRHGVWARGGRGDVQVFLDRVTVEGNVGNGIRAQGSGARVRINRSAVTNNGKGLKAVNGGRIISLGNNAVIANTRNGAPTATAPSM